MKTKKGYVLRTLGKEYILAAEGLETKADRLISMNESAAFLWKAVDGKDFDTDTLINLLVEEYGITREVAQKDVAALLEIWKKAELVDY